MRTTPLEPDEVTPDLGPPADQDRDAEPVSFPWGSALRRALLRGLLLGLSLGASLWLLTMTVLSLVAVYGPGSRPGAGWIVLSSLGAAAVCGAFAGVTQTPLALLEFVAAASRRVRVHAAAAACSAPLTLLLAAVVLVQFRYAAELAQTSQPGEAAWNALWQSWRMLRSSGLDDLCLMCGLISAVPYALFARLRGWPRARQLAFVAPATAATATLFALGFAASSSLRDETGLLVIGLLLVGVATILGVLLPAAFDRADQVEGWVARRVWPDAG